jgi:hypothetical protein
VLPERDVFLIYVNIFYHYVLKHLFFMDGHHLTDSLAPLGLRKCRILAQLRLNQTQFYWNNTKHELRFEEKCTFCNLADDEDLFHFLVECRIHRASQQRFLNPLQQQNTITTENLLSSITTLTESQLKYLIIYCITCPSDDNYFWIYICTS